MLYVVTLVLFSPPVVAQAYKVEVEVLGASRGCTAVLRCVVPSFVKDLIRVMSWVQEPSFYVYPLLQGGKPGHQTPLDVLRADVTDRTHTQGRMLES